MKRLGFSLLILIFVLNLLAPLSVVQAANTPDSLDPAQKAAQLLQNMTPEEKVGQLFLVSFKGTDTSATSQIYDLVANKHIGGVVLTQANDNFTDTTNTVAAAQSMITSLQNIALTNQSTEANPDQNHIPLFVAVSQEGDGSPNDQILNGMTPLADEMAIGATWNTSNAEATGQVLGEELNAIGFNLLLGPSLDVLDSVYTIDSEDLGVRSFGGDPFWVGEMGKAYIQGVHEGSNNQVAVIAKNFPGRGSADRPAEDEVATVRKSLEQLKQIELAPFFSVTTPTDNPLQITDGLLVSHIRYQGFQGNIRATTKPISLDSTALNLILSLSPFSDWRKTGGIMVSDDLGVTSIQKFYDPTGKNFDARQVARTAFLAGNDLLYLGDLVSSGDQDNYTTVTKIIDLFLQKYQEDSSFASKVDDAVGRILTLKFKMYPNFNPGTVLPDPAALDNVGKSQSVTFQVASQAVTLISPSKADLDTVLPNAPQVTDRIVFVSDRLSAKQCSSCTSQLVFSADDFRNSVISLYGPGAGAQVQDYRMSAYSFDDLKNLLDQTGDVTKIQDDLAAADWIVFSILDENQAGINQEILRRFLSEKTELIRSKRIIGFAFNAPYYLDATDISKLTAYYGVYGKTQPFIEVASRVLFQELTPTGSLPVSVPGVGYDIIAATTPDPNQVIKLMVDNSTQSTATETTATKTTATETTATTAPSTQMTATPTIYKIGDTLAIQTGVIVDNNGHPVPDGTVARFMIDTGSSSGSVETVETTTVNGIAKTTYRIPSKGLLGITVQADPAMVSQTLRLNITDSGGILTAIEPTLLPTPSSTPVTTTPTETPPVQPTYRNFHSEGLPTAGDWLLSSILILSIAAGLYWLGRIRFNMQWGIRWATLACLGGYLVYFYLVIGLPGSSSLIKQSGSVAIGLLSVGGAAIGWAVAGIWWVIEERQNSRK